MAAMANRMAGLVTTYDTRKLKEELDKQKRELDLLRQHLTDEMKEELDKQKTELDLLRQHLTAETKKRRDGWEDLFLRQNAEKKKTKELMKVLEERITRELMYEIYRLVEEVDDLSQKMMVFMEEKDNAEEAESGNQQE